MKKCKITFVDPPQWDISEQSITNESYVDYEWDDSLVIIEGYFSVIFRMICDGERIYAPGRLRRHQAHDQNKINQIIDDWNNGKKLCPILFYLSAHDNDEEKGLLVMSGNHRLSVLRAYFGLVKKDFVFPFLMKKNEAIWLLEKLSILKIGSAYNIAVAFQRACESSG